MVLYARNPLYGGGVGALAAMRYAMSPRVGLEGALALSGLWLLTPVDQDPDGFATGWIMELRLGVVVAWDDDPKGEGVSPTRLLFRTLGVP